MKTSASLKALLSFFSSISPIIKALDTAGARVYLVGGCVRDILLDRELKDFDLEVHCIDLDKLEGVLKQFGVVILVGKQFGVLKLMGINADWAIPREDSKGRKPTVSFNPHMTIEQAARRRDVTINSMALLLNDLLKNHPQKVADLTIIDPYGGLTALKKRELAAIDEELFCEDPLRFYRVMQFASRFEMMPNKDLSEICARMELKDSTTGEPIARERVFDEIKKMLIRSKRPSLGLRWIDSIGRLEETFPELAQTKGVQQRKDMHPEKDVFEHTMQSLDAAAQFEFKDDQERLIILLTMICHDLGKITTTTSDGKAHGHDIAGEPLAYTFLKRYTDNNDLIKTVCKFVRHHLAPGALTSQDAGLAAYKRLAKRLFPHGNLRQLALVGLADNRGRNGKGQAPLEGELEIFTAFTQRAQEAGVLDAPEAAILQGRDLLGIFEPGPELGRAVEKAYTIQINENITDLAELKKRVAG